MKKTYDFYSFAVHRFFYKEKMNLPLFFCGMIVEKRRPLYFIYMYKFVL